MSGDVRLVALNVDEAGLLGKQVSAGRNESEELPHLKDRHGESGRDELGVVVDDVEEGSYATGEGGESDEAEREGHGSEGCEGRRISSASSNRPKAGTDRCGCR